MEIMPERMERTTVYESEHVCLYTDKVRLPVILLKSIKYIPQRSSCNSYI